MPTKKRKPAQSRRPVVNSTQAKPYNVFISWSGVRSQHIATALAAWLPRVLQQAKPWLSRNIDKGTRPLPEIAGALETIEVGITCLTPENLTAPWILFEGGALSKSLGDKTRLCTYLLAGLEHQDVPMPLGMFQHTRAGKEETKEMIVSLNKVIGDEPLADEVLDDTFEKMWPDLKKSIDSMPAADSVVPQKRTSEEMLAEVLESVRELVSKDNWREKESRTQANYRFLFDPNPPGPDLIPDEQWTKNGVVNCPRCGSANVVATRSGQKMCKNCAASNF
ncbi:MAG TPA: hypothetical protein VFB79_22600 [Candidatus Angelobacter sp.]|nr:hypothetical protein [Candidatus Angelobacter sp.]